MQMNKKIRSYQRLATLYNKGEWGNFGLTYSNLLDILIKKYNFRPQVIIDIACGTGNLIAELHKRDYHVIGVDISPEMIEVARKNNPNIRFHVEDMTCMNLGIEADLVTCAFDSINYLLDNKQLNEAFKTVNKHLKHGGFFLFDVNTPFHYEKKHFGMIDHDIDGIKFKQNLKYDKENRTVKITFDFGNKQIEEHTQKAYTSDEIVNLLSDNNFVLIESFQDFALNPPKKESERIFFFAQKS